MKKLFIAALAATTCMTGVLPATMAAAQPGYYHDHDRDRDHRDHNSYGHDRNWDRWDRDADRWRHDHGYRYYGRSYGYNGYHGRWRTGQRYPYWRDNRYYISDWRAYNLPPPAPGYRYYRDDNGDVVMAAVASGMIGLIIGGALSH
jgi:Ni/Co efflux regulator RcnB